MIAHARYGTTPASRGPSVPSLFRQSEKSSGRRPSTPTASGAGGTCERQHLHCSAPLTPDNFTIFEVIDRLDLSSASARAITARHAGYMPKRDPPDPSVLITAVKRAVCKTVGLMRGQAEGWMYPLPNPVTCQLGRPSGLHPVLVVPGCRTRQCWASGGARLV